MTSLSLAERETVRSQAELDSLCLELRAAGRFAVDTEFLGERTYVPRLCLVQIATVDFIVLVDTLAVPSIEPLRDLIADHAVVKVLHAAREDLRIAYYGAERRLPASIFDTQVAAGLVGLPLYPLSYARLTEALMGVRLDKAETRSEWDRRPLSPEQVRYARDDVRYLLPVADKLAVMLERLGRSAWMTEEMGRFSTAGVYEPEPDLAYLRLRGARSGLSRRPTAHLRAVAAWRERYAADQDVPARTVVRDELLIDLALRPPQRLSDFTRVRGFPVGEEATLGPGILEALAVSRALSDQELPAPLAGAEQETPRDRSVADLAFAVGSALCLSRNLAPELVITKGDALALARGSAESGVACGWRREAIGAELEGFVKGSLEATIRVDEGGARVQFE
jgi:ribonuclease D